VEIPFIILVQIPALRFELVKGGSKVDQSVIRKLDGDDFLAYDSLPPLLNIYAYGNFEYDKVTFYLNGPYRKRSTTSVFPYALYENELGFAPYVGNYTLTVTAAKEDSAIVTNSIQFSISYKGTVNITKEMEDWAFYPNPVEEILNIKLPETQPADSLAYEIVTVSGKRIPIPENYAIASDNLANIDLFGLGLPSGIYFVRLKSNGALLKQFRIFKK
jgi:hypothetical protein